MLGVSVLLHSPRPLAVQPLTILTPPALCVWTYSLTGCRRRPQKHVLHPAAGPAPAPTCASAMLSVEAVMLTFRADNRVSAPSAAATASSRCTIEVRRPDVRPRRPPLRVMPARLHMLTGATCTLLASTPLDGVDDSLGRPRGQWMTLAGCHFLPVRHRALPLEARVLIPCAASSYSRAPPGR